MKNYFLLACFLLPACTLAQLTEKNSWLKQGQIQVGVGVGAGRANISGGYLRATPYAQYFHKDGWALRLEGRYNYTGPDGDQYLGAGLSTQYHFLRTSRFSVFGQAGYFYGQTKHVRFRETDQTLVTPTSTTVYFERYREQFNYGALNTL